MQENSKEQNDRKKKKKIANGVKTWSRLTKDSSLQSGSLGTRSEVQIKLGCEKAEAVVPMSLPRVKERRLQGKGGF